MSEPFQLELSDADKISLNDKGEIPTPSLSESAVQLGIELDLGDTPKKRGRKSKVELESIKVEQDSANNKLAIDFVETVKPTLRMGLNLAFARLPDPLPIEDIELDMFCTTLVPVAKKYAPKLQQISPEFIAHAALGIIIAPRLRKRHPGRLDVTEK